jgi:tetratricopeptide (TPR) repeat protein
MKKILLLLLAVFSVGIFELRAQVGIAQKYVKIGNTLREAKQYEESERYLEKGLKAAQAVKDRYWTAAAYENLGFLNRDRNDFSNASYYFSKSIELFNQVGSVASVKALQMMVDGIRDRNEIYGGIDIGAKGIKLSVIGVKFSADGKLTFRTLKSDDINATPMSCTDNAFKETAKAVKIFLDTLANRGIPRDRMFVVASSGLKQELDKCGKADALITAIKAEVSGIYFGNIEYITACNEAELVTRGTLPNRQWNSTTMIDIGSGNTKGGYYSNGQYECIDYYGTGAFTKLVQANQKGRPFAEAVKAVYDDEVKPLIASEMGRKPGFQTRDVVNMAGGIVYAMTTFMHPDKILEPEVTFTYNDVKAFNKLAVEDFAKLTSPDLSRIDSDEVFKTAQSEIKKIREKVFTQEQIIAGSALLLGILDEIRKSGTAQNKKYIFQREAKIGWISGYVVRAISKGYQEVKE